MERLNINGGLNDRQWEAVRSLDGPLLILAGAGSGKTRVITYRIAQMIERGIGQESILALTFTNKAAREMANRVKTMCRRNLRSLTVSTFHAFGVRVLREHIQRLGYSSRFSIYDEADKGALIKDMAEETGLRRDAVNPRHLGYLFSGIKNELLAWNEASEPYRKVYEGYSEHLKLYNAVDFDDLIVLPRKLLRDDPDVLDQLRGRYRYIMVDEFQDTSIMQYSLLKLLADGSRNICVVGDDDQSIYSWRGASYGNLLSFERDYPEYREIFLDQNYRSTGKILLVANHLIAKNKNRKGKNLWTGEARGEPVRLYLAEDESGEGLFIAQTVKALRLKYRIGLKDFGVLVRTNNLTRPLEEAFLRENLPYRVSGGMSFFQRKEVKDILSYLRVIANPDDNLNLLRILNLPRRGIGRKTVEEIVRISAEKTCSYYSALSLLAAAEDAALAPSVKQAFLEFTGLIESYSERFLKGRGMAEALGSLVEEIDYWGYILARNNNANVAKWKYGNVEGLLGSIGAYERDPDNIDPSLYGYLNRITLITKEDSEENGAEDKINLTTIHAAKGLEFDTVFLAGLEKDVLPHSRSLEESGDNVEEERRLFYVAITRARKRLYLSSCAVRWKRGKPVESGLSPFIEELPAEHLEMVEGNEYISEDEALRGFAGLKEKFRSG